MTRLAALLLLLLPTSAWAACPEGLTVIVGTAGDDVLVGTAGPDCIRGLGGDDILMGLGGDDVLIGGGGNDQLQGGAGDDTLRGGRGVDVLIGGAGVDVFEGGDAEDIVVGDTGRSDEVRLSDASRRDVRAMAQSDRGACVGPCVGGGAGTAHLGTLVGLGVRGGNAGAVDGATAGMGRAPMLDRWLGREAFRGGNAPAVREGTLVAMAAEKVARG